MVSVNALRNDPAEFFYQALICALVGLLTLLCLFPLIYVVGMSFTSEGEMIQKHFFVILPERPTAQGYVYILRQQTIARALVVSVSRTALTTFLTVAFVLAASYVLAERRLPGRRFLMFFTLVTMMIGGGLIPGYLLMASLHLLNTFTVLVIPCLGYTYGILVIKTFIEEIPGEITESADMDGAGDLVKLARIVFPLTLPSLAAIALFTAVGQWNSWFDAMVYLRDTTLFPVSLVIRNLLTASALQQTASNQSVMNRVAPESIKMASVVVAMLPILCVYPFLQKYFVHGVFTGAVKG